MKKDIFKKAGKGLLALSIVANTFMPITLVNADTNFSVTLSVVDTSKLSLEKLSDGDITVTYTESINNKNSSTITSHIPQMDTGDLESLTCTTSQCVYVVKSGKTIEFNFEDQDLELRQGETKIPRNGNSFAETTNISISALVTPQEDPPPPEFDGKTTLIWTCGSEDSEICYKQLTGLSATEVNWIKASTIEAENKAGVKFNVHAREKFFSPQDLFESKKADIDSGVIKVGDLKGPDGLDYMPVGEPIENNALVSYGNRQFKAVVYGDDYKGVTIGDLESLDYYPQEWNDWFLRRETYDMGGTTRDESLEIDTLLLQRKINLKLQTDLNDYNVTKIEALDVPENAVLITKKNDGSYDLDFQSNFYDKVVFKVTTDDNKEQFIYINRRTTDPWIRTDNGKEGIVVETFFDRVKSYNDLDVIARIVNKDGSSKVVHLEAEKGIDDKLGHIIDDYEVDEQTIGDEHVPKGKGMKRSNFVYAMSKDDLKKVDKIYINVEYKGSSETTYAGNFAGSGRGDVIDMKYWEDRL